MTTKKQFQKRYVVIDHKGEVLCAVMDIRTARSFAEHTTRIVRIVRAVWYMDEVIHEPTPFAYGNTFTEAIQNFHGNNFEQYKDFF